MHRGPRLSKEAVSAGERLEEIVEAAKALYLDLWYDGCGSSNPSPKDKDMRSTKTVLAIAIVIAGFAYAIGSAQPTLNDSLAHRCCGPQPEDFRVYRVPDLGAGDDIIIPKVEGANGFMLTYARTDVGNLRIYQDTGEGPVEIFFLDRGLPLASTIELPLVAGSTITVTGASGGYATIVGYVY